MGIKGIGILKGDDDDENEPQSKGRAVNLTEQQWAEIAFPDLSSEAALTNYRLGLEIYDENGDHL